LQAWASRAGQIRMPENHPIPEFASATLNAGFAPDTGPSVRVDRIGQTDPNRALAASLDHLVGAGKNGWRNR